MAFKVKFDSASFTADEQAKVTTACGRMDAVSAAAVAAVTANTDPIVALYFGAASRPELLKAVEKMHAVVIDSNRTMTFVDVRGKSEKFLTAKSSGFSMKPIGIAEVSVLPMTATDYAYVKPVEGGCGSTAAHVGSGMRLFLGERFFHASKTVVDHVITIYHELTHKVIATKDHRYGEADCQQLALTDPAKALTCADNYAYLAKKFVV